VVEGAESSDDGGGPMAWFIGELVTPADARGGGIEAELRGQGNGSGGVVDPTGRR
jgi:hypothetical protein